MRQFILISFLIAIAAIFISTEWKRSTAEPLNQPIELGKVNWERSLEKGIQESTQKQKPVFILFQEVPGCSTCQRYGQGVLSHPLIVEAIQSEFIPVAIYNNKKGADAEALKYFGEPSWNNPVVRIVSSDKKDITKRVAGNYSELGIVTAMIEALDQSQIPVPEYLSILKREFSAKEAGLEEATVSMYCFWTGEKKMAKLPGVIETLPGFMNGKEVVQIKYDPAEVDYEEVLRYAKKSDCASHIFTQNEQQFTTAQDVVGDRVSKESKFRMDADPKYYLSKTNYQYIPMTALQSSLVNAEIGDQSNPDFLLSPWQLDYLKIQGKGASQINIGISEGWKWQ